MKALNSSSRSMALFLLIALSGAQAFGGMITDIFVFGDSLSDTGNVLNRTMTSSLVDNRPANPWYDTGRWTNGPSNTGSNDPPLRTTKSDFGGVWHERLADKLKLNRATNSLAGGNNRAYGGATTGTGVFGNVSNPFGSGNLVELNLQNVREQVNTFIAGDPTIKDTQLFAVWGGGNDVRDAAVMGATVDNIKAAATTALTNMKNSIAALAAKGAKRFLWPNLPPLDKTPEAAGLDATLRDGLKQAAELFRDQQAAAIAMLKNDTPGIAIDVLDVHGEFLKIVEKPGDFGLEHVATTVINIPEVSAVDHRANFSAQPFNPTATNMEMQVDPDKFLFWDQVHPTAKGHDLIAMAAFRIFVPEPASLALLAAGFIIFVLPSRPRYVR